MKNTESACGRQVDNLSLCLESTNPDGSTVASKCDPSGMMIIHVHLEDFTCKRVLASSLEEYRLSRHRFFPDAPFALE